jgi:hypothetical protein
MLRAVGLILLAFTPTHTLSPTHLALAARHPLERHLPLALALPLALGLLLLLARVHAQLSPRLALALQVLFRRHGWGVRDGGKIRAGVEKRGQVRVAQGQVVAHRVDFYLPHEREGGRAKGGVGHDEGGGGGGDGGGDGGHVAARFEK